MDAVEFDGKKYLKAADAAKQVGYTADYVGQLCRAGKVDSRVVGRTWYVEENALAEHKRSKTRSNKKKATESFAEKLREYQVDDSSRDDETRKGRDMPAYRKRLLDANITYIPDDTESIPYVKQGAVAVSESTSQRPKEPKKKPESEAEGEKVAVRVSEGTEKDVAFTASKRDEPSLKGRLTVEEAPDDEGLETKPIEQKGHQEGERAPKEKEATPRRIKRSREGREHEHSAHTAAHTSMSTHIGAKIYDVLPTAAAVVSIVLFVMTVFVQSVWVYNTEEAEQPLNSYLETSAVYTVIEKIQY